MNIAFKCAFFSLLAVTMGCASLSASDQAALDRMAEQTVTHLEKKHPGLQQRLDGIPGYLVVDMNVLKVPVFGGGGGRGVVVDSASEQRTYVKVTRMEIGGGWGGRAYKVLLAFTDPKLLESAKTGKWIYQLGAEASVGTKGVEGSSAALKQDNGYELYIHSEGGASATYTLRAVRLKPYRD
jgi:lipid-binding SYLF domain-containing protein